MTATIIDGKRLAGRFENAIAAAKRAIAARLGDAALGAVPGHAPA